MPRFPTTLLDLAVKPLIKPLEMWKIKPLKLKVKATGICVNHSTLRAECRGHGDIAISFLTNHRAFILIV